MFSVRRIPAIPNNPSSYNGALRSIVATEAPDPHTVIFRTDQPNPILPSQFTIMAIVSSRAAAGATAAGAAAAD
ncbi:MAG: ABC transporter substrate-binding protein, partial [Acidobacteriota bacterium]|nr:ABC transporter substrate-binding protein [Acidobacteriota bacterium]